MSWSLFGSIILGSIVVAGQISCPGYKASNVQESASSLTADLDLAGPPCNIYGTDLPQLRLSVDYQTETRLHVIIEDRNQTVYQVPDSVFQRPGSNNVNKIQGSELRFTFTSDPFSFSVVRPDGEVLFDTAQSPLVFESQYLRLRTSLPTAPNLYGLGEHADPFKLNTTNYTRTIWTRDAYGTPPGTNLYGAHPVYVDHRGSNGTHGVLLLNSNGMDIKINDSAGQYLEYNILGGVLDFYFVAGPSPLDVSQQLAEVLGLPAMIPYSGLGFHQCRYGYRDIYQVAEVIYNYSAANIPLETMWTDIDYMHLRRVFSLDPERFPLQRVRELVDYLHSRQQQYTVMVDPAVAYVDYEAFNTGRNDGIFMKDTHDSLYQGVVWPGVSVFPDWFHPRTQQYWTDQFESFFDKESGVDIDFLWIDMNEPANFCNYPCSDPEMFARESGNPPAPPPLRDGPSVELPIFPSELQSGQGNRSQKRQVHVDGLRWGLPDRNLADPPYKIGNEAGSLSNKTADTSLLHYNGLAEYDTHNLYGTMMSNASRQAMLARRPGLRPLIITRSTFMGAGAYAGHWLGDNLSDWTHYRFSISQLMQFAAIFQIPMVGSDVCGFGGNTTETLCARWMMLGAFYPFYRNHNELSGISQEAYRWESVAAAARYAIDIRYRLLDYYYTAFYIQTKTGRPSIVPLFFLYPSDSGTFGIEHQFFFGDAILVSPVLAENTTSLKMYLPNDIFYDWNENFRPVRGGGQTIELADIGYQTIPLHVRGGTIVPLRLRSANTTAELRKQPFEIVIAPGMDGSASGSLYLDEGSLLEQTSVSLINMTFANDTFRLTGQYEYSAGLSIQNIIILGIDEEPTEITMSTGQHAQMSYNGTSQVLELRATIPLTADTSVSIRFTNRGSGGPSGIRSAHLRNVICRVACVVAVLICIQELF